MSGATRYRKKPVEIEAVQWTGDNHSQVMAFTHGYVSIVGDEVHMTTVHGDTAIARRGDWVLPDSTPGDQLANPGPARRFYPCNGQVFAATYDAVDGPAGTGGGE